MTSVEHFTYLLTYLYTLKYHLPGVRLSKAAFSGVSTLGNHKYLIRCHSSFSSGFTNSSSVSPLRARYNESENYLII